MTDPSTRFWGYPTEMPVIDEIKKKAYRTLAEPQVPPGNRQYQ